MEKRPSLPKASALRGPIPFKSVMLSVSFIHALFYGYIVVIQRLSAGYGYDLGIRELRHDPFGKLVCLLLGNALAEVQSL